MKNLLKFVTFKNLLTAYGLLGVLALLLLMKEIQDG